MTWIQCPECQQYIGLAFATSYEGRIYWEYYDGCPMCGLVAFPLAIVRRVSE